MISRCRVYYLGSEPDGGACVPSLQATGRHKPLRRRERSLFPFMSTGTANQ